MIILFYYSKILRSALIREINTTGLSKFSIQIQTGNYLTITKKLSESML